MIPYKLHNLVDPLPLGNIRFGGYIASLTDRFFSERHTGDFARRVIYAETERQFSLRDDDALYVAFWRGEFWGKWCISACRIAQYYHDADLTAFLRRAAHTLIATADADGYIGTYRNPEDVLPRDPDRAEKECGIRCDFNWNIWCRKYTLWGLLEIFQLTGDSDILSAAVRTADQMLAMLRRLGLRVTDCGTFCGMPAGSVLKPLLLLYRLSGENRFLTAALEIAADWERPDGKAPNILKNALDNKPVHTWYPGIGWAKAYEMMSAMEGIIELYRITGTKRYLSAAENFCSLLWEYEQNVLFSVGFNDQFTNAAACPNALSEPCDVIHWMRLCYEMFRLTGSLRYMDIIERVFYNPLLASVFKDGRWGARAVRTAGRHLAAHRQANMEYSHCCVNNLPRGLLNGAECFVMRQENRILIHLYSDFSADCGQAKITLRGSYLKDGRATVRVEAAEPLTLCLRIPAWSRNTSVMGRQIHAPGTYHTVEIRAGITEIDLDFHPQPELRTLREAPVHYPPEDFRIRRFVTVNPVTEAEMTWDIRSTLCFGPLLLTRSKLIGCSEEEMFAAAPFTGPIEIRPETAPPGVQCAFTVQNGTRRTHMCDYASGTNLESPEDGRLFNVYI